VHYAVLSDVHANFEALEAVFHDIKKRRIKKIIFLGDAVGYGPNPNECIEAIKDRCIVMLAGNHDYAVAGLTDANCFNDYARLAVEWTLSVITEANLDFLRTLSISKTLDKDNIFLVHSTPNNPEEWHYLLTLYDAETSFNCFDQKICFLGHSHYPIMIERLTSGEMTICKIETKIRETERYIINVGSVGQPRDGDPRASYAVVTDGKVELIRVKYDIEKTQGKMLKAGLPLPLITRLEKGL
jgi:predicted phosphodiesterase